MFTYLIYIFTIYNLHIYIYIYTYILYTNFISKCHSQTNPPPERR